MLDLIRPTAGRGARLPRRLDVRRDGLSGARESATSPATFASTNASPPVSTFATSRPCARMDDLGDGERLAARLDLELDRPIQALSRETGRRWGSSRSCIGPRSSCSTSRPRARPARPAGRLRAVRETTEDGRSVFVSSHVLSEVQRIADQVALIRDGRLELVDTVETLRRQALTRVEVTFATAPPTAPSTRCPSPRDRAAPGLIVRLTARGSADRHVKRSRSRSMPSAATRPTWRTCSSSSIGGPRMLGSVLGKTLRDLGRASRGGWSVSLATWR